MATERISRRTVLAVAGAAMLTRRAWAAAPAALFSAGRNREGIDLVVAADVGGRVIWTRPLPDRGHAATVAPDGDRVVIMARRPGRFAVVLNADNGRTVGRLGSAPGRHFYGHAVFSPDGRWLYATENDYEAGRGVIGVYDANDDFRRRGELSSHGVGPHQLLWSGGALVVANGGMQTHPDSGRTVLNLATMQPSLARIDPADGRLLRLARLPAALHQLSIRHIAATAAGTVVVGMQHQGPLVEQPPLMAVERGGGLELLPAPAEITPRLKGYVGSVAVDRTGGFAALSHPRGGLITFWRLDPAGYVGSVAIPDGCGLAMHTAPGRFLASSGTGGLYLCEADAGTSSLTARADFAWDNHLATADRAPTL